MHIAVCKWCVSAIGDTALSSCEDSQSLLRQRTLEVFRRSLRGGSQHVYYLNGSSAAGCLGLRCAPRKNLPMIEPTMRWSSYYVSTGNDTLTYRNWWGSLA